MFASLISGKLSYSSDWTLYGRAVRIHYENFRTGDCDFRHNRYSFLQINENASRVQAGVIIQSGGENDVSSHRVLVLKLQLAQGTDILSGLFDKGVDLLLNPFYHCCV
ncbi:hypothetical protein GS568_10425 [Escherichia coli]|nr:hypothetical protein [Escherichia coli]